MKNQLLGLLLLLGLASGRPAWAQELSDEPGNPLQELRESLGTLDPGRISTGVLLDRTLQLSNPHRFNGWTDTVSTYRGFDQQYFEFYHASLDTSRYPTLDALQASIAQRVQQGSVPLLMLRYNYNELAANAANENLITIDSTNGRVYDGPDLSRSPYATGQFFSVTLPAPATANTMSVYVGQEFWLGNQAPPAYIWLYLGPETGWQQVAMGSTVQVPVQSAPSGPAQARGARSGTPAQTIYVRLPSTRRFAVTRLTASTRFTAITAASEAPDLALGLVASRAWPGFRPSRGVSGPDGRASAIAWIKYAPGNEAENGVRKLRKPLVFVEGIDFADYPNKFWPLREMNRYIDQTGPISLSYWEAPHRLAGGYRNGAAGWNEMVDYNEEYPSLEKFPALRAQLQSPPNPNDPAAGGGSYDVIYLDFSDGATLIQHNAMVLAELLEWINKPENRTAEAEETMVIGTSMGGQVARFALAWMEQQNICHNSKLYVSFDSPHRGANIPIGIQHMFNRLQDIWIGAGSAKEAIRDQVRREASMQMLNFHYSGDATGYRTSWQNWQQSPNSYPSLLRKVAVANGSGQAEFLPGVRPGDEILRMKYKDISFSQFVAGPNHAYALPGTSTRGKNNVVFRWKKAFFARFNGWRYAYADPSWGHFDTAPGSTSRIAGDATEEGGPLKTDHPINTFMPTLSTLDVRDAGSYNNPDFTYNIRQQIPESNLPNRAKYAFDAYFAAGGVNEPHVQITDGRASRPGNESYLTDNAGWIQNELRESAHLLPAVLTYEYNYGSPYRHLLPSVQVNQGGELYVNHRTRPIGGGDQRFAKPPGVPGTFEAYTSNCATVVQLNSGGLLGVGTPGSITTSYPATLRMAANSLLDLRAGGRVDVNVGSELRIVAGATLVVRNGATLNIFDGGRVIVETGAYLCVENSNNIVTSGTGTYTVQPGVYYAAKSGFNLGTLACAQPAPLQATIAGVMTSNCTTGAPSYSPNYAQWTVAPSGGTGAYAYRWSIDYGTGRGYEGPYSGSTTFGRCLNEGRYAVATVRVVVTSGTQQVTLTSNAQSQYGSGLLYPNPADTYVEIGEEAPADAPDLALTAATTAAAPAATTAPPMQVTVYNGQGKVVFQAANVATPALRLDTQAWPAGLYQVVVQRGKTTTRRQLSVQH
jgi:hypothetical protein